MKNITITTLFAALTITSQQASADLFRNIFRITNPVQHKQVETISCEMSRRNHIAQLKDQVAQTANALTAKQLEIEDSNTQKHQKVNELNLITSTLEQLEYALQTFEGFIQSDTKLRSLFKGLKNQIPHPLLQLPDIASWIAYLDQKEKSKKTNKSEQRLLKNLKNYLAWAAKANEQQTVSSLYQGLSSFDHNIVLSSLMTALLSVRSNLVSYIEVLEMAAHNIDDRIGLHNMTLELLNKSHEEAKQALQAREESRC